MTIHIFTDSTCDLPQDIVESLPISVVPLYITLNGKDYRDTIDITREAFYQALPDSDSYPTTATPSPEQFKRAFDQAVEKGASTIFSIHVSKTFSGTFQCAESAAKSYTKVPVHVVDSGNLTMAEGMVVICAARAAQDGRSVEEVKAVIDSAVERAHAYAKLDTIDYLHRGGRMSTIQHSIVSILGIKPILKMNNHVSRMEIARTKRKAFERVLHTAIKAVPNADIFGITHANVPGQVEELIERLKMQFPDMPEPLVTEVTPALGVHVGPGGLCINWIENCEYMAASKTGIKKWLPKITGR